MSKLSLVDPPRRADGTGMVEPWLRRDYTSWWLLPDPLPPPYWPRLLMGLIVGVIMTAIGAGM
jgi:hypothetical protein